MAPMSDRTRYIPARFDQQTVIILTDLPGFQHFDIFDLHLRATLVGQLQAVAGLQVNIIQQVAGDAFGQHIINLFFVAVVEGAVNIVQQPARQFL